MSISFFTSLKKDYIVLFFILLLAIFLRFYNLNAAPPSASLDEASIGWNAYSVLHTGRDEYNQFPLISQRGYDDWRRSTYLFLTIPTIGLFGLNAFAERLPAVILSILTVFSSFWIVRFLFAKETKFARLTSLLVPLLLTISPWHVYISRLGHESNACLSFLIFGMAFFLWGEKTKKFVLIFLSFVFFTLSMISYYSGQIFIPVLIVALFILYRKNIFKIIFTNKKTIVASIVFAIFFGIIFANVFSPASLTRFQGTSTFTPDAHGDLYKEMVLLHNSAVKQKNIVGSIFYNRRFYPIIVWAEGYVSHFDPRWLFFNAYQDPFKIPNMGLLYIWELPFILLGIYIVATTKELSTQSKLLIFLWFLLGPLPASVATQTPHAMRSYNFLPTWQLFTAVGLVYIFYTCKKIKIVSVVIFGIIFIYSIATLYRNYFIIFPKEESEPYQYAMKATIQFLNQNKNNYKKIIVSNQNNLYQSYMFYLFYSKYDPKKYQQSGGTISGGFRQTHVIDNIAFRPIDWKNEEKETLLIGNPSDFPTNSLILFSARYPDGAKAVMAERK